MVRRRRENFNLSAQAIDAVSAICEETLEEAGVEGRQCGLWSDDEAFILSNHLLAQAGLSLIYTYKNGRNCLTCNPPKKSHMGQMTQLVIAVAEPVFNMILGGLRAVSSPLVFLAVCCGIAGFSKIYQMILGIVPSDIVSPFLEGNALQIVFLGVCVGAALLIVGDRVSYLQNIVMQANDIVQFC